MLIICKTLYVRIPPLKFYYLPPKPPPPIQLSTHPPSHTLNPLPPIICIILPSFGPGEIAYHLLKCNFAIVLNDVIDSAALTSCGRLFHIIAPLYPNVFFRNSVFGFFNKRTVSLLRKYSAMHFSEKKDLYGLAQCGSPRLYTSILACLVLVS